MDTLNLSSNFCRPEASHTLWRSPEIEKLLANGEIHEPVLVALRNDVGRLHPVALALIDALEVESANFAVHASEHARGRQVRDCLATDLIASALLLEAIDGGHAARRAIDALRRQRGCAPASWMEWPLERDAESVDDSGELAAPQP